MPRKKPCAGNLVPVWHCWGSGNISCGVWCVYWGHGATTFMKGLILIFCSRLVFIRMSCYKAIWTILAPSCASCTVRWSLMHMAYSLFFCHVVMQPEALPRNEQKSEPDSWVSKSMWGKWTSFPKKVTSISPFTLTTRTRSYTFHLNREGSHYHHQQNTKKDVISGQN